MVAAARCAGGAPLPDGDLARVNHTRPLLSARMERSLNAQADSVYPNLYWSDTRLASNLGKLRVRQACTYIRRRKRRTRQLTEKTSYLQWNTGDVIFDGINGGTRGNPWDSNLSPPTTELCVIGSSVRTVPQADQKCPSTCRPARRPSNSGYDRPFALRLRKVRSRRCRPAHRRRSGAV